MSVTNKARDRDSHGRIHRKYTRNRTLRSRARPSWFVKVYVTRPHRRANKRCCLALIQGADADAIAWPLGNHNPQVDWD